MGIVFNSRTTSQSDITVMLFPNQYRAILIQGTMEIADLPVEPSEHSVSPQNIPWFNWEAQQILHDAQKHEKTFYHSQSQRAWP